MTVEGAIFLSLIAVAFVAMVCGVIADGREQRAHDEWQHRYHDWLAGGMHGSRP